MPVKILMIHIDPCIRVVKEIRALQKRGFSVDLCCKQLRKKEEIKEYVGHIYRWSTLWDLRKFLEKKHKRWDIIHCHNEPNDFIAVAIDSCRERPVIYDCHDFTGARTSHVENIEAAVEEFCFKYSAATIHVSEGIKQSAFKKYGPHLSIVLPSLPSSSSIHFIPKPKLTDNHLVYEGGLVNSDKPTYSYRYYFPFFKQLCEAGINVHVFPSLVDTWESMPEYFAYATQNPRLHLHPSLPYAALLEEMSQFQWGLVGFNFSQVPEEGKEFLNNALPNKIFDYLYAGVCPIVINNTTSAAFVQKNNIGYAAESIKHVITICTSERPLPPLKNFDSIDMDKQISRLIGCYEACTIKKTPPLNSFLSTSLSKQKKSPDISSLLDILLEYYTSKIWLHKQGNIYYSHTSADSHAFYLMALNQLHIKQRDEKTLQYLKEIADVLLGMNNSYHGGNPGWGLGATYFNKLYNARNTPIPAHTTFTYTSCVVGRALLGAYEITGEKKYLDACTSWRQSFFDHIGLHPENGCCRYADHESYKPLSSFVPNVTPLFMLFLAEYARITGSKEDKPQVVKLCKSFMVLEKHGNWQYYSGKGEDLLHLAMIAEGLYYANNFIGNNIADATSVIRNMLEIMFSGLIVRPSPYCLGSSNWGPAWALSVFRKYGIPEEYITVGTEFLKNNLNIMFFNIRTAGLYAKFLSEVY